jgi:hypothetical protein
MRLIVKRISAYYPNRHAIKGVGITGSGVLIAIKGGVNSLYVFRDDSLARKVVSGYELEQGLRLMNLIDY